MTNLNTQNPENIRYQNGDIHITIMGGIKLNGLDRLRVTLKVESCGESIRHNLDLYNDIQLLKFIRKTAERLAIGTSIIGAVLGELITELENYRLQRIAADKKEEKTKKILTQTERSEAIKFLTTGNLLLNTNEQIGRSGMIGEENNRLLMYLIFTSRKREQPLHIVSLGASGTGKTHLQEKVSELIPEEDKLEITVLSENAFYYFERRALAHKLILIEDLDGAEAVLYPLRELQSKKRISKTVARKMSNGETKTINLTVEGPVSVAGCTTKESIYEDNANRSFLIYLDESPEQDERIMNYQRRVSSGKINKEEETEAVSLLQNCQRILEPIKVINPYAELLHLPQAVLKARRTNAHYLQFIEAITFYHQYQREQKVNKETGELFIETNIEDIENANQLLKETLLRKSDELTGACRNYFEKLKLYLINRAETIAEFTNREIREKFRITGTTLRRYHIELRDSGYLRIKSGKAPTGYTYEIVSYEEYKNLKASIDDVLDNILTQLKRATPPPVSQQQNGSLKKLNISKKNLVSREN